jgi:hypothetical protein
LLLGGGAAFFVFLLFAAAFVVCGCFSGAFLRVCDCFSVYDGVPLFSFAAKITFGVDKAEIWC